MSKFIVTRNGEHIGENHPTREKAQEAIIGYQFQDALFIEKGWINQKQAKQIQYAIIERK